MLFFVTNLIVLNLILSAASWASCPFLSQGQNAVEDSGLPSDFKSVIDKHPIASLKRKYGDGSQLVFGIQHSNSDLGKTGWVGESIQASFLRQILTYIFPKATYVDYDEVQGFNSLSDLRAANRVNETKQIFFGVADVAEARSVSYGEHDIPMVLLKPANPLGVKFRDRSQKQKIGIPEDDFVLSLYLTVILEEDGSFVTPEESLLSVLESLDKDNGPDVVFVSFGGALTKFDSKHFEKMSAAKFNGIDKQYHFTLLSHLASYQRSASAKKLIVFNDTIGRMTQIYAASDAAIVLGPINMFEPLTAGTPLLYYDSEGVTSGYDRRVFDEITSIARATGGALGIENSSQIPQALSRLPRAPNFTPPYLTPVPGKGQTPAQILLNKVNELLINSI